MTVVQVEACVPAEMGNFGVFNCASNNPPIGISVDVHADNSHGGWGTPASITGGGLSSPYCNITLANGYSDILCGGNVPDGDASYQYTVTACYLPYGTPGPCSQNGTEQQAEMATLTLYTKSKNAPTPGRPCALAIGRPCQVVTGEDWYEHQDFAFSGPFGLKFSRFYDNQSTYAGDLGNKWRHTYDENLDLSRLTTLGLITYYDKEDNAQYFSGLTAGGSAYNDITGDTLALNAAGTQYTLTTWHGIMKAFDANGNLLQLQDRSGNTQTIARDPSNGNRISSVTDSLNRALCFYYGPSGHITEVAEWLGPGSTCPSSPPTVPVYVKLAFGSCGTNHLCSVTESDGGKWQYQYDSSNPNYPDNLLKVTDPNNNVAEATTYNGNMVATQNTGSINGVAQNSLSLSYGSTTTTVTDGNTNQTVFTFDSNFRTVTKIAGPLCGCGGDQSRSYTYDPYFRLLSMTDGNNHTTTYKYTRDVAQNNVITPYPGVNQIIEPLDSSTTRTTYLTYGDGVSAPLDALTSVAFPSVESTGSQTTVTLGYNSVGSGLPQGVPISIARKGAGPVTSQGSTYAYDYDSRGRLKTVTGPNPNEDGVLSYFSDSDSDLLRRGQLQTLTLNTSSTSTLQWNYASASGFSTYDIYGHPLSITDPNSVSSTFAFDSMGRMTTKTIGVTSTNSGYATTLDYDLNGNIKTVTKPLGNLTKYQYDIIERLSNVVRDTSASLDEEQIQLGYDPMSEPNAILAQSCTLPANPCASGNWTTTRSDTATYDTYGRLQSIVHPTINGQQTSIQLGYDLAGNVETIQDENHTSPNTTIGYDYANRVKSIAKTLGSSTIQSAYAYDILDDVVSITDENNNQTTYKYDDFMRQLQTTSPVSGTTKYTYDPDDNLLTSTDANQNVLGGQTAYTYDALDRMLTQVATVGSNSDHTTWTYDTGTGTNVMGRLASEMDPSGSNDKIVYSYNGRGDVTQQGQSVTSHTYTTKYSFDKNDNLSQVTYPSGQIVSYTSDYADRPYSATQSSPATNIVTSSLYEPFGPLQQLNYGNGIAQSFSFDLRYRPTEDKVTNGSTTLADYLYNEDGVGNVTGITDNLQCGYSLAYSYDDLNRIKTANTGSYAVGTCPNNYLWGQGTYQYDAMGNISSETIGTRSVSFTPLGTTSLLQSVSASSGPTGTVGYDNVGNETSIGPNSYTYSAREMLASDVANGLTYKYDGRGIRTKAVGSAGTRYSIYGPDFRLASESSLTSSGDAYDYVYFGSRPIAQIDANGTHADIGDHLGSPYLQTDFPGGNVLWQAEYEPFGNVYSLRSGDVHQPLRLPGQTAQQFDTGANGATDLEYNVNRWYRPLWGRYSQPDPIGEQEDSNTFAYVDDNPINAYDSTGLCKVVIDFDLIALGQYHAFIVASYGKNSWLFRGGPSTGYQGEEIRQDPLPIWWMLEGKSGDEEPFGQLFANEYTMKYEDYTEYLSNAATHHQLLVEDSGDRRPCDCELKQFRETVKGINQSGTPYYFLGTNSNYATFLLLESIGINLPEPPWPWSTPGWGPGNPWPTPNHLPGFNTW